MTLHPADLAAFLPSETDYLLRWTVHNPAEDLTATTELRAHGWLEALTMLTAAVARPGDVLIEAHIVPLQPVDTP